MSFFLNLSTKAKLLISFLAVIVLNLIVSVSTIVSLYNTQTAATTVEQVLNGAFTRIVNVQASVERIQSKFAMGLNPDEKNYSVNALFSESDGLLSRAVDRVNAINPDFLGTTEYRNLCLSLKDNTLKSINIIRNEIIPIAKQGKLEQSFDDYMIKVTPLLSEAGRTATNIFRQQNQHCINISQGATDFSTMIFAIILTIVSTLIGIFMALFISGYIDRSLSEQVEIIDCLKNGDFTLHINDGYKDEFGQSHDKIRQLRNTLSNVILMTQDETVRLKDEMNLLRQIAKKIAEVSSNIQNQAITVAAASDEMVSTTTDIARNCETAATGSTQCKNISNSGMEIVELAMKNIRQQSEHTKDNATKIENLARQSREIGSIVSTIDDIAAQTNLLALNAAIEAARAGEAGRGFAVVADEVRALASRTSQSTQEISKMVKNIQDEANMATESINVSVENMDHVAEDAQNIVQILNDITERVNDVNTQITQIATAAEEQTAATSEISSHMQDVTVVAADMSADADNQYQAMTEATHNLEELQKALSYFKVRREAKA